MVNPMIDLSAAVSHVADLDGVGRLTWMRALSMLLPLDCVRLQSALIEIRMDMDV